MGLNRYEAVMKAVSDPTRVRILKILESGEICVCQVIAVKMFAIHIDTLGSVTALTDSSGHFHDMSMKPSE